MLPVLSLISSPEEGNDILEWIDKIPWTEEPGRLYNPWDHPTLCDPTDGNPPGSPVPGILQACIH